MNAAAAARLDDLIGGANPVRVDLVQIQECDMTPTLIRQRFAAATCIDINEAGMGGEERGRVVAVGRDSTGRETGMSKTVDELRADARLAEARLAQAEADEQRRRAEAAAAALAAVGGALPPVWFERPRRAKKGEPGGRDPYFHRAQWDWDAEIEAGFQGWMAGNARGVVLIHFASAVVWFEGKLRAAQVERGAA